MSLIKRGPFAHFDCGSDCEDAMTTDEEYERLRAEVGPILAAAHHAYCHDTGCFDGDDISQPQIEAAAMLVVAQEVAKVLREACGASGVCREQLAAAAVALVAWVKASTQEGGAACVMPRVRTSAEGEQ